MSDDEREAALLALAHCWEVNGDLEQWAGFDREMFAAEFPEILKAWDDFKAARMMVPVVIRGTQVSRTPGVSVVEAR